MDGPGNKAGHLIRAGAIATALRHWHRLGRTGAAWHQVRRILRDDFPMARTNSIEAVVKAAQQAAGVGREMMRRDPDWQPRGGPDVRRKIRDAFREPRPDAG